MSSNLQEKLNDLVPNLMKKYRVAGCSLSLIWGDRVNITNFGYKCSRKKIKVNDGTQFQIASISKALSALGLLKLYQKGLVDLDMPISVYITRWKFPKTKYDCSKVTLRNVLCHTSGLGVPHYFGIHPDKPLHSIEESLDGRRFLKKGLSLEYPPGEKFFYSGGGYTLLQLVIEEVTGKSFSEYMKEEIFTPFGMEQSGYFATENTSKSYFFGSFELPCYKFTEKAAAGLFSTTGDLSKYVAAHLNHIDECIGGLRRNIIHSMQNRVYRQFPYGLGMQVNVLPNGHKLFMHRGINIGWSARIMAIPKEQVGIVLLTNSTTGEKLISQVFYKWLSALCGEIPGSYHKSLCINSSVFSLFNFR